MTLQPPAQAPARVLVQIDEAALARWVPRLVEMLRQRPGCEAFLRVIERRYADSSALRTLLGLEKMLLRRHRPCGADRIGRAEVDGALLAPADFRPDIVIDLAEGPGTWPEATRLRPLYDGEPGETALAGIALLLAGLVWKDG